MDGKELLLQEWRWTYDEEDWYPPLRAALAGVDAKEASWRADGTAANTIWETVTHLLYYKERFLHRLSGTNFAAEVQSNEETFIPQGSSDDEEAWKRTVQRLEEVHHLLYEKLRSLTMEELQQPLPQVSVQQSAMSLVMHDAFHTGQIVQLRKMRGTWPAQRS